MGKHIDEFLKNDREMTRYLRKKVAKVYDEKGLAAAVALIPEDHLKWQFRDAWVEDWKCGVANNKITFKTDMI